MSELTKRLKELVEEGKISQEAFEEVDSALKEEEAQVEHEEHALAEKPVEEPKVEEHEEEHAEVVPPVVPPVVEKPLEEKVEPVVEEEEKKEEIKEEVPAVDSEKIEKVESSLKEISARIEQLEKIIKDLGEFKKDESKEEDEEQFGVEKRENFKDEKDDSGVASILNKPGMGGFIH